MRTRISHTKPARGCSLGGKSRGYMRLIILSLPPPPPPSVIIIYPLRLSLAGSAAVLTPARRRSHDVCNVTAFIIKEIKKIYIMFKMHRRKRARDGKTGSDVEKKNLRVFVLFYLVVVGT